MKNPKNIFVVLSIILLVTGSVAAQEASLASLPKGAKFTSTEPGFSISLPKVPTNTNNSGAGGEYVWKFKEGMIVIEHGEYLDDPMLSATNKTHKAFLRGYKDGFMKQKHIKFVSEAPFRIGTYSGMIYLLEIPDRKLRLRDSMLTFGKKYFSIVGSAKLDIPGSEALILKALNSLRFTAAGAKP